MEKSAEAIVSRTGDEGPNMETEERTQGFTVMEAQKIQKSQPEPSEGEAFGRCGRCVK